MLQALGAARRMCAQTNVTSMFRKIPYHVAVSVAKLCFYGLTLECYRNRGKVIRKVVG